MGLLSIHFDVSLLPDAEGKRKKLSSTANCGRTTARLEIMVGPAAYSAGQKFRSRYGDVEFLVHSWCTLTCK
jgi:hypothetical protein